MPTASERLRAAGLAAVVLLAGAAAARGQEERGVGSLLVTGAPAGRQVWIEGKHAGLLPIRIDSLPAGPVWVEVGSAPAEVRWRPTVRVRARVRQGLIDTLRIGAAAAAGHEFGSWLPAQAAGEYRDRYRPVLSRKALLLPAAAIAFGVAGFWTHHEADRAHEDYRRTLDRREMRRSLDRARQLDRVAIGCWIAAEACLASAAWIWLRAGPEPGLDRVGDDGAIRLGVTLPLGGAREPSSHVRDSEARR